MLARNFINAMIAGIAVVFLVMLGYAVIHHIRYLTGVTGLVLYYIVPGMSALFFILSFWMSSSSRTNILLVFLSISFCLLSIESAMYLHNGNLYEARLSKSAIRAAAAAGVQTDDRSKVEVIESLRSNGTDAYPSYHMNVGLKYTERNISGNELLPFGGISNKTTVLCNEDGSWAIYKSDEHGFRNPQGLYNPGNVELAAVGDSFTHGSCVFDKDHFFHAFRKRFSGVLNFGVANSGPLTELGILREYIEPLKPKRVLWFFYEGNDFGDIRNENNIPLLAKYFNKSFSQHLLENQPQIDKLHQENLERSLLSYRAPNLFLYIMKLTALRSRLGLMYNKVDRHIRDEDLKNFQRVLTLARDTVRSWGGQLYFVYLPQRLRIIDPTKAIGGRDKVLSVVKQLNLPVIDMYPAIKAHPNPSSLYPFGSGHNNGDGYRLIAEQVIQFINEES